MLIEVSNAVQGGTKVTDNSPKAHGTGTPTRGSTLVIDASFAFLNLLGGQMSCGIHRLS
jgi:hypothetical protein